MDRTGHRLERWSDGKILTHRSTTPADCVAWLQRLDDLRDQIRLALDREDPVKKAT